MGFEVAIEDAILERDLGGCVMAATNASGTFRYQGAFGRHKIADADSRPYGLDTQLYIASCTKLLTSIAVLQCVERGLIGLDDDVAPYLPRLAEQKVLTYFDWRTGEETMEERARPLTLRLLITHSAGACTGMLEPFIAGYRKKHDTAKLMFEGSTVEEHFLAPLAYQPGTKWKYGGGHDWAGVVVEKLTSTTLDEYFRANIAEPLGITSFTFWPKRDPEVAARMPETCKRDGRTRRMEPDPAYPPYKRSECFGGGGMSTTVPDYLKVLHSLLVDDEKLLSRASTAAMFTPQLSADARESLNILFGEGMPMSELSPGFYPHHVPVDWGLGALLSDAADPGWRGNATLSWSGYPNLFWFIDRQNQLCGMFGTSCLPCGDSKVRDLTVLWEKEMYRRARVANMF